MQSRMDVSINALSLTNAHRPHLLCLCTMLVEIVWPFCLCQPYQFKTLFKVRQRSCCNNTCCYVLQQECDDAIVGALVSWVQHEAKQSLDLSEWEVK